MSEYSIHVSNGKVIGDSTFFLLANDMLHKECKRLCDFTDALDKEPMQKKQRIAEYKCAKYRYAAVSTVHSLVQMNNFHRQEQKLECSNYLLCPFDDLLKAQTEYFALFEAAPTCEKPDYSLYYAMLALIKRELSKYEEKLQNATDWEKIELEERIGGWSFAKECLDEAWEKRKDVIS